MYPRAVLLLLVVVVVVMMSPLLVVLSMLLDSLAKRVFLYLRSTDETFVQPFSATCLRPIINESFFFGIFRNPHTFRKNSEFSSDFSEYELSENFGP